MQIGKREYKVISAALQRSKESVQLTQTWRKVHDTYEVGRLSGCGFFLVLSARDRLTLTAKIKEETGYNPRTDDYEDERGKTRTEAAVKAVSEKLLSVPVRSRYVEVRQLGAGAVSHPSRGYAGVPVDYLLECEVEKVLVIENFDTFISISEGSLPSQLKGALLVYRGDNKASPRAVRDYLAETLASVYHFGDFDPEGLKIALTMTGIKGVVLPSMAFLQSLPVDKRGVVFRAQSNAMRQLESMECKGELGDYIALMKSKSLAVMQERMIALKADLRLLVPIQKRNQPHT